MCIISSKKQVNRGVKSMSAKAMSWSQVCKQISGIGGYVEFDEGKEVRPLELMQSLGVHVNKNSYTPKDIFTAWSARMMKDGKVQIVKSVPYMVVIGGKEYILNTVKEGKHVAVRQQTLCNLVSAADKAKGSNDVAVTSNNVLRGLMQSVYVTDTFDKMQKSVEKCEAMTAGWINMAESKSDAEVWVEVIKGKTGEWSVKVAEVKEVKRGRKGGRKAA